MKRLINGILRGALLGLAMGVCDFVGGARLWGVLPDVLQQPVALVHSLIYWPPFFLIELDRHRVDSHVLYESKLNTLLLFAVYWMLLGELCYWTALPLWCRFRRNREESRQGAFPVK